MNELLSLIVEHYLITTLVLFALGVALGIGMNYGRRTWIHRLADNWFGERFKERPH